LLQYYYLHAHYTKGTEYLIRALIKLFSDLFHENFVRLFSFHSRYLYTIGVNKYLALELGCPLFRQIKLPYFLYLINCLLQDSITFFDIFVSLIKIYRLFMFRSPLLHKSLLISFPFVTKMIQFTKLFSNGVSPLVT